ncbi:hypothetical protein O1611_g9856 [Lasiodiplodia mahajangana]|uniref:Uncharacterized protein n=1 Tax=Lasiodiplodia mahajangana TaxID=1108764 RepID=A0ACC2J4W8_9PEZI|nr:hypothetical protein O1611_g9856 [Lasiodiplodia mahajangana]
MAQHSDDQLALRSNIPAVAGGDRIITALDHINQSLVRINTSLTAVEDRLTKVEGRVTNLETLAQETSDRLTTLETLAQETNGRLTTLELRSRADRENSVARVFNVRASTPSQFLRPIYSVLTGEPLDSFPATKGDLDNLTKNEVVEYLRQLDLRASGSLDEKRRTLALACGIAFSAT